jgi:pseudouridine-5'-phosphate glycosidase
MRGNLRDVIRIQDEVAEALAAGRPVVALESTIFSEFGLPPPVNRECLEACTHAIRTAGAVPAMTVVLDGEARVGVDEGEWDKVLRADRKLGARDIPVAVGLDWPAGATTVSGALHLAALAGISVFATGGIGGVHRDVPETGDISADLPAIARYPVVTVTAGAKAFLDLPRTVEYLETLGVPVLGLQTDEFPAFYSRSSGVPLPHRVESPAEAAAVARAAWKLGHGGGLVLGVPIPEEAAMPREALDAAIETGLAEAEAAGVRGAAVTPFILGRLVDATGGSTLEANVTLAVNNARVAAELASALADDRS